MNKIKILSTAMYTPQNVVTNDDLSRLVDTSDEWITSRTGIKKRCISKGETTSELCTKVVEQLLAKSGLSPPDIDLIIVATMTPDYLTPSTACLVQKNIGAINSVAFDINAACSGFIYAFSIAEKFIISGTYKNVIVLGADIMSKVVDWSDRGTCVLFGDGAGGVILTQANTGGVLAEDLHSDGERAMAITSEYIPKTNLAMNGREVFNFAIKEVPKSIQCTLDKAGINIEEVKYIIPHQANIRIIEAMAKKLNIDMSKFYINIQNYGNTTAATIPIAIAEMIESGILTLNSGDKVILTGFGAGLTWGTILVQI